MQNKNDISCSQMSAKRLNMDGGHCSVQILSRDTSCNCLNNDTLNPTNESPSVRNDTNKIACANVNPTEDLSSGMNGAKSPPKKKANSENDFSNQADEELARWMKRFRAAELRIVREQERRYEAKLKRRRQIDKDFGDLCEATEGLAKYWRDRDMLTPQRLIDYADGDAYCIMLIIPLLRKLTTRIINRFQTALTRPLRYKKENKIRRKLAAERRKITKRKTTNPCPTVFQIFEAWEDQKKSHVHYLRLGALLEDLECYVDNSLRFDENGCIVGREHGIKGWIQENLDFLTGKYSSMMRCKATAKRLRQIANIKDPNSLLDILPAPNNAEDTKAKNNTGKLHKVSGLSTDNPRQNTITVRSNFCKSQGDKTEAVCEENEIMMRSNLHSSQGYNADSGPSGNPVLVRDDSSQSQLDKIVSDITANEIMVRSNFDKSNVASGNSIAIWNEIMMRSNSHYPNEINGEKSKKIVSGILDEIHGRRTCLKDYFDGIIEIMETLYLTGASMAAITETSDAPRIPEPV